MGYSTRYTGRVEIVPELTITTLNLLKEGIKVAHEESEWALKISEDSRAIQWRGAEKTRDFEYTLTALENWMQSKGVGFTLEGYFTYQGEDTEDRGDIIKVNGVWTRMPIPIRDYERKCPECGHIFTV